MILPPDGVHWICSLVGGRPEEVFAFLPGHSFHRCSCSGVIAVHPFMEPVRIDFATGDVTWLWGSASPDTVFSPRLAFDGASTVQ